MIDEGSAWIAASAAANPHQSSRLQRMKLEGIHHITATTADAPRNVEFFAGLLGLRMVKKTVNQDDPTVYHLFYADDAGSPGADLTFFEYPQARRGRTGDGMVHRVVWRVAGEDTLEFWRQRLDAAGVACTRAPGSLRFEDPEGLGLELVVDPRAGDDAPLRASAPDVPAEHALLGFAGVRAYASEPQLSAHVFGEVLGFTRDDDAGGWTVRGDERGSFFAVDAPPAERGLGGAGVVHHVAFSVRMDDYEGWNERLVADGQQTSGLVDRYYFRSIYFREPSGVLFELATMGPGFDVDESGEALGERLSLPPKFEQYRERLEQVLTPLPVLTRG
jgi:glyoxalase family protein